jgi:plasmid stabilization system protein ParE
MKRLVFTDSAQAELEAIGDHIARDSPLRAETFLEELLESCRALGEMPMRFPVVPRLATLGIRRRVHGNYLILYRVGRRDVEILHVLHGAMDYERLFFPED